MDEPNYRKYSISEVAEILGVSPSTVSRAINGKKGVGKEQRDKILKLVKELGYQPNTAASPSGQAGSNLIALVIGDIRNPFYADLEYHIQEVLGKYGLRVAVFNSEYNLDLELEILQIVKKLHFAGIFLVTAHSKRLEEALSPLDIPKVLVNRNLPSYTGDSVLTDNFQAGYLAAMHLIDLYHQRIGFVRAPQVSSASAQRFEGFRQALANFSLPLDERFVLDSDLKLESGRDSAREFLRRPPEERPTAMVITNDMAALGFLDECRRAGLSIPEDLSIISFDDIIYSSIDGIGLTTVSQHVEEMGHEAARLMLKQLGGDTSHPERIILPPELIVRKTTAQI